MRTHLVIAALAFAATIAAGQELPSYVIAGDAPPTAARTVAERAYGRLPLIFSRGTDAADGGEQWIGRTGGQGIAIDRSGFVLARRAAADEASIAQRTFTFVDASAHARIEALDPQPARVHHIGRDVGMRGETDQPTFARVRVADLYAGIDVAFYGTSGRLEYDVIVAPGADPGSFRPPPPLPRPPIGWSTGFIEMPRTVGRMPRQRLAPALPIERRLCSSLPTSPITARQSTCTLRISPERNRTCA